MCDKAVRIRLILCYFFVLPIMIPFPCYKVEVTERGGEKGKIVSLFEIVDHDNPPFETEADEFLYKDETTLHSAEKESFVTSSGKKGQYQNKMKKDGVKVSGFLGNVRHKRSLEKLSQECMRSEGEAVKVNQAVTVETGETIHLPCHDCREDDVEMFESMEWIKLYQYPNSEGLFHIKEVIPGSHDNEEMNRISVTLDHTLVIKRAKQTDAGSYFCKPPDKGGAFMNLRLDWNELQEYISKESRMKFYFHVDVIDLNHADTVDVSSYSNTKPMRSEIVPDLNIEITTRWHHWTSCSVCGDVGIRKRMGICYIRKYDSGKTIPHDYLSNILKFAADGVPCQSQFLRDFREEPWLRKPNQIEIEECNIPCKNSSNNIRKRAINILAKSQLEEKDIKEAMKTKKYRKIKPKKKNVKIGEYFILKCPGISLTKTTNWVNGTKLLPIIKIQKVSNKRITMDMFGNLHFKGARISDGGTYSCWIKKRIKQKYEVKIEEDKSAEIKMYTIYLCISFVGDFLAFFTLAIIKFLQRKVQHRKRKKGKEAAFESKHSEGDADDESSSSADLTSSDSN